MVAEMSDLIFWIQVVEIPVIGGIFMIMRGLLQRIEKNKDDIHGLSMKVAESYTSKEEIKGLRADMNVRMNKIEEKLDIILMGKSKGK